MSDGPPAKRRKRLLSNNLEIDMRFNEDFNERQSRRAAAKTIFDGAGRYRATRIDACDCLDTNCVGCFFPCPKCGNTKCGTVCRRNRNDVVISSHIEGKGYTILNSYFEAEKAKGKQLNKIN